MRIDYNHSIRAVVRDSLMGFTEPTLVGSDAYQDHSFDVLHVELIMFCYGLKVATRSVGSGASCQGPLPVTHPGLPGRSYKAIGW